MRTAPLVAAAALAALAGCTGVSSPGGTPTTSPSVSVEPVTGQSVPEALRSFTCRADDEGVWSAQGMVANLSSSTHTYAVTAQVGPADGQATTAKQVRVTVSPRSKEPFSLTKLPAASPDGPCHLRVQVVD